MDEENEKIINLISLRHDESCTLKVASLPRDLCFPGSILTVSHVPSFDKLSR